MEAHNSIRKTGFMILGTLYTGLASAWSKPLFGLHPRKGCMSHVKDVGVGVPRVVGQWTQFISLKCLLNFWCLCFKYSKGVSCHVWFHNRCTASQLRNVNSAIHWSEHFLWNTFILTWSWHAWWPWLQVRGGNVYPEIQNELNKYACPYECD